MQAGDWSAKEAQEIPCPAPSDSELIVRYLDKGSQDAFATLVERYQVMVVGTAFRRTGNSEMARDVAQVVFATLSRKLSGLTGRASLGGWLYQATVYESARAVQGEERRRARQARFAADEPASVDPRAGGNSGTERLSVVDEVLGTLSAGDREVVVLHYFQELSYTEMAGCLGTNEPAVRQRVCRALERLSKRLKERGVAGSPAALLVGAAGIHASIAAPAGLATSALAAAAVAGGSTVSFVLSALLSPVALKGAASVVVAAGLATLWHGVEGEPARKSESEPAPTYVGIEPREPARISLSSVPSVASIPSIAVPEGSASAGTMERLNVAGPAVPMVAALPRVPAPAASARQSPPAKAAKTAKEARESPGDVRDRLRERAETGGMPAIIDELRNVELVPADAAEVYGDLLAKVLALDAVETLRVEEILHTHFEALITEGVAGVKPGEITRDAWQFARQEVIDSTVDALRQVLPEETAAVPALVEDVLSVPEKLEEYVGDTVSKTPVPDVVEGVAGTGEDLLSAVVGLVAPITAPIKKVPLLNR